MQRRHSALRALLVTAAAVTALFGCGTYSVRPQLAKSDYRLTTVAVVPFRTTVSGAAIGAQVLLPRQEEEQFRQYLVAGVKKALAPAGVTVVAVDATTDGTTAPAASREVFFELGLERQKAVSDIKTAYKSEFRYRCSDRVAELAQQLGVDGFVLLDFEGVRRTTTEHALAYLRSLLFAIVHLDPFTEFPGGSFISGDVEVLDGPSGDLLFFNQIATKKVDFREADEVSDVVEDLLEPFADRLPAREP